MFNLLFRSFYSARSSEHVPSAMRQYAMIRLVVVLLHVAFLGACKNVAGPDYVRPDMPQKDQWSQLEGRELTATEVVAPDWWKGFGDEYLNRLVDSAIQENLNLKIASARLDKAAIQLKKERFPLSPEVQSAPTSSIQRSKSETAPPITTRSTELLGATLSWEIDIWGKIRKGVLAEEVGYRGMEMDWRAAYLSLITNVAERYFQIRLFDEQITQQQASLQQSQSLLQIFEAQYREGLIPETRLLNQRSEINGLTKQLLDLQRARTESELRLATLLGKPAGTLEVPVANLSETIDLVTVPLVLPADLLARRPDVLRAEYDLLQAHHLVGRARLARLPSFSLTASANTGSSLSDLLLNTWTFGLATSLAPLFDRNLKIDVPLNEAEVKVRIEQYRQVVLRAFEEVEVALLNLDSRLQQMQQLQQQIANLRIVQKVQQARLREGLVSQLEVFETERSLLNARKAILGEYQASLNETVRLYKALGGGWPPERPTDHSATVAAARGEK